MEHAESQHPMVNILGAANEIFQVLLLNIKATDEPPKISFTIKSKGQVRQNGLNLFCFKVTCSEVVPFISLFEENCLPQLSQIICEMQAKEEESHVAVKTVNHSDSKWQKTSLLWLETHSAVNYVTVKILKEVINEITVVNHISTVLEIRMFISMSDIIQCGKGILDLLERIKLLNPEIQLSFLLHSLSSVEVNLSDTSSISCGAFNIYSGCDLYFRKNTSEFACPTMKVQSSKIFEICFKGKNSFPETASLACISCFVPIYTAQHIANDVSLTSLAPVGQDPCGHIRVYGPGNLPLNMKNVRDKLNLTPHLLLPWQHLGFQVKTSFSCSYYDLHCSAKITNKAVIPFWATQCQHFCLLLAFIVNWKEVSSVDAVTIYRHLELFQYLEQQILTKDLYPLFQEAAYGSMVDLFSSDKFVRAISQQKLLNQRYQPASSELYKKMIPDVVSSLADIFVRSTSADFRSKVSTFIPISSRTSMSAHLEMLLWKIANKSQVASVYTSSNNLADNLIEEPQVDEWDNSQDSLFSVKEIEALSPDNLLSMNEDDVLSPDSLDLEWEDTEYTAPCQNKTPTSVYTNPVFDDVLRLPNYAGRQQGIIDDNSSDSLIAQANLSKPSNINFESYQQYDNGLKIWEHPNDFLSSICAETFLSNKNSTKVCCSSVTEKEDKSHTLSSFSCSENNLALVTKYIPEAMSTKGKEQIFENLTRNGSIPPANCLEKMPRKRSSEYLEDTVSNETYHESGSTSKTDSLDDRKKQRCQSYESSGKTGMSHYECLPTIVSNIPDNCSFMLHGPTSLDQEEEEKDEDTFSSCWFDEQEIANWCAELDK